MNLRDKSIDDLVNEVQTSVLAPSGNNPQSIMAVVGRCTIELSDQAKQLSTDMNHTKAILGERLTELTTQIGAAAGQASADINSAKQAFLPAVAELVTELKKTRKSIAEAGSAASAGTDKLVRWTGGLVIVTILYAVFTGGLLAVSSMQLRAANKMVKTTARQLEITDRPWLTAQIEAMTPLGPIVQNANMGFVVGVKNIGKSVATHVTVLLQLYPQPFTTEFFSEPLRAQATLCGKARRERDDQSKLTLFPNEEAPQTISAGMEIKDILGKRIVPILVGCVDYRYGASPAHHQTLFAYEINQYEPKDPFHPSLIDFTRVIKWPPANKLRAVKYFFGGNDAD